MYDYLHTIVLVLIYFLIVYLTAIRRDGQRALPWIIAIAQQGVTSFLFRPLADILLPMPFFTSRDPGVCAYVILAGHLGISVLTIILVNKLFPDNVEEDTAQTVPEARHDRKRVPAGAAAAAAVSPAVASVKTMEPDILPSVQSTAPVPPIQNSVREELLSEAEPAVPPIDMNQPEADMMFATIDRLVESGQKEDAIKYLRMVAFYETDQDAVQKAERLLAQLQP